MHDSSFGLDYNIAASNFKILGSTSDGGQYQQSVLKDYLEDPSCTLPKGYFNLGGRATER